MENMTLLAFSISIFLVFVSASASSDKIQLGFYRNSCPEIESLVRAITWVRVAQNPALPAKLLRLHFHDCFVRGCDGSVLLDTVPGANQTAEKDAIPNKSLGDLDVIDDIKNAAEKACPGTVSCADILTLAARDSVSFQFKRSLWEVETGRRDGRISRASEALADIPSPFSNFTKLHRQFADKNLTVRDLVALSGAHTIGRGHCSLITAGLYNSTIRGGSDPSLSPAYAAALRAVCSPNDTTTTVDMDPGSSEFDAHYFSNLKIHQGLFSSDAALLADRAARASVSEFTRSDIFFHQFGISMKKMGAIGVLTGSQGEIRRNCRVAN